MMSAMSLAFQWMETPRCAEILNIYSHCDFVRWDAITGLISGPISLHSMPVVKMFWYNYLPELLYTTLFPKSRHLPMKARLT